VVSSRATARVVAGFVFFGTERKRQLRTKKTEIFREMKLSKIRWEEDPVRECSHKQTNKQKEA